MALPPVSPQFRIPSTVPEYLSDGIACVLADESLTLRYLNPSFMRFLGVEAKPAGLAAFMDREDRLTFPIFLKRLAPDSTTRIYQRLKDHEGHTVWLCASCQRVTLAEGSVAFLCQYADLRYLKASQTAGYADKVPCGVFKISVDTSLTLLYANSFFYNTYGYTRESAQDGDLSDCRPIVDPQDFDRIKREIHAHIAADQYDFELENRGVTREKKTLWMLVRCHYTPEDNTLFGAVFDITDRKAAEEALRISEEEKRIALRLSDKFIARYDLRTKTMRQSPESARLLGQSAIMENVPESFIQSGLLPAESVADYRQFYQSMLDGDPKGSTSVKMFVPAKGVSRWFNADYSLVYNSEGEPITAIISFYDSTELHEREVAYERWTKVYEQKRMASIAYYEFNLSADILETFEGPSMVNIPPECQSGLDALSRFTAEHFVIPEDRKKYRRFFNRERLLEQHRLGSDELSLEHRRISHCPEGFFWARADLQMIDDPFTDTVRLYALIQDIDAAKRRSLEMRKLSQTDPLTGLYNRSTMTKRLGRVLRRARGASHALIILDIDHFKELNDTYGHQFGDTVLLEVADALRECLRNNDFCGRLGGDEFIIFMRGLSDTAIIRERLNMLRSRLRELTLTKTPLTVSIGIARFPVHGSTFQELYEKADQALYEAKRRGRNTLVFFE